MDGIPTFCIVDERKQFVPLRVQGATGAVQIYKPRTKPTTSRAAAELHHTLAHTGAAADCCVAWVEPLEAQDALAQARYRRDVGEM